MNSAQQAEIAWELTKALRESRIIIERPVTQGGNVSTWVEVSGEEVLGRLMASSRWRVRLDDVSEAPSVAPALRLER